MAEDLVAMAERMLPQPMESAPKDRKILLFIRLGERIGRWEIGRWNEDRYNKKPRPFWDYTLRSTESRMNPPSAWLPLPSTDLTGPSTIRSLLDRVKALEAALDRMLAVFDTPSNGSLPGAEQETCAFARAALSGGRDV